MFSPRPPHKPPNADDPHSMRKWSRQIQSDLEAASRFIGPNVGGGVPTATLPLPEFIWGQITDPEHGSGTYSGVTWDSTGPGFFDSSGYLTYAFQQIYADFPWKGILVKGGISTELPSGSFVGCNFAYPLGVVEYNSGDNVLLKRTGAHWTIVGLAGQQEGSGGGVFTGECPDGTRFTITVDGSHVAVEYA